jgi:Arc/MetJ-type ribon-helix-helix transcriptional regulator
MATDLSAPFTIRLPNADMAALVDNATARGVTLTEVIREAVREWRKSRRARCAGDTKNDE